MSLNILMSSDEVLEQIGYMLEQIMYRKVLLRTGNNTLPCQ